MTMNNLKTLVIGLVLGICLIAAFGQAPATPQPRYQISVMTGGNPDLEGNVSVYVLDHRTSTVAVYRQAGGKWQGHAAFRLQE